MPAKHINDARDRAHLSISHRRETATFEFRGGGGDSKPLRDDYPAHAESLLTQLALALDAAPQNRLAIDGLTPGSLVEIGTMPLVPGGRRAAQKIPAGLEMPGEDVVILKTERNADKTERAILFVPDTAREVLKQRIAEYGSRTLGNRPRPYVDDYETIETILAAGVGKLFVGLGAVDLDRPRWWELWIREPITADRKYGEQVASHARAAAFDVLPDRLEFPETTVVFIHAAFAAVAAFAATLPGVVAEIRSADTTLSPFLDRGSRDAVAPFDWVDELASRITPPPPEAAAVCVLDSGVNADHPLIRPALAGAWAYDDVWLTSDHEGHGGHGTGMVSLVLYGSLEYLMASSSTVALSFAAESMKLLPPAEGFSPTRPAHYGIVTQGAVAKVEASRPNTKRSFVLACSTTEFPSEAPSTWSGALDQIAAGSMMGDRTPGKKASEHPKRLIAVATGNVDGGILPDVIRSQPVEDPAQSWNALSIGGYTAKEQVAAGFKPAVPANHRSPFSKGSNALATDLTPIKPEVLFEAGNMAADTSDFCGWHEDLSMLAAGSDVVTRPLIPFWATSAAAGLAGNFFGRLEAGAPGRWPETYRALTVDSARWTQPMLSKLVGTGAKWRSLTKPKLQAVVREFGYGVPDLDRALRSARNDVSLVAEAEIQPYKYSDDGRPIFNEVHFYKLPWPRRELQKLQNASVMFKVTLSYFIEPNLTGKAATRPDTYRSFGLRYELKKAGLSSDQFRKKLTRRKEKILAEAIGDSDNWLLGSKSVQAGSLHCDIWRGYAVDLALYDEIAIFPVGGWWKSHVGKGRVEDTGRYALVLSIQAPGQDVDLHTEIEIAVGLDAAEVGIS